MREADRYNRADTVDYNIMIMGIPNVGKSCLINKLRQQFFKQDSVAKVGATAGVTRAVMNKIRVCSSPPIFVLDTPGILEPKANNTEAYLKLALICKEVINVFVCLFN